MTVQGKYMARQHLTRTLIEDSEAGWLWDADAPGLGVRVLASGVRSYVFAYGSGRRGLSRRLTLGQHGAMTLDQARRKARRLLGAVADGRDPAREAALERGVPTVAEAWARYVSDYARLHKRASTVERDQAGMRLYVLPAIGSKPLDKVTREDVTRLHAACSSTRASGNRALAVLSHLYRMAGEWRLVADGCNPTRGVRRYAEPPRERFLSAEEWARLGPVLDARPEGYPTAALRVLIFTGARLSEVLGLRWPDVDLDRGAARLARRKTGPLWLTLPGPAVDVLRELPRLASAREWVFPGRVRPKLGYWHVSASGMETYWQRVRKAAGLRDVRLHDLRHTFASVLAGRGVSLPIIGGLLGHSQPATTARYAHLADGPLRVAADGAAGAISAALKNRT